MKTCDWKTWKLSHAYSGIGSGTTPTSSDARYYTDSDGTPWVTTAELRENYISTTLQQVTKEALENFPTLRMYKSGSVMIAMYGATIGRLGMTEVAATCNQACCVFEASEQFDNRFLFYWLWHRRSDLVALSVGGGQPNLSQQDLRKERVLCPPLDTQRRIARFLDEKTAQIDGLIEKKQELIDHLAEKRQAIITRAVTKGLNPDTLLKPSDISARRGNHRVAEGAVDVTTFPTRRLRFACEDPLKYGANAAAQYDDPKWPRFVRITDITESGQLKDDTFRSLPPEIAEDYLLEEGDILLARSGSIGRSFIYKTEWGQACFAGYLIRARLSKEFDPRFVYWSLNTLNYWLWIESIAIRSTIQNVSAERYAEYAVPAPPLETQRRIAWFLDEKTARIDRLIERIWDSIAHLEEYRSAQITAAVTGQFVVL